jgi:hypothetical protein
MLIIQGTRRTYQSSLIFQMLLNAQYPSLLIRLLQGLLVSRTSVIKEQQYCLFVLSMLLFVLFDQRIRIRRQILFSFQVIRDIKTLT